MRYAQTKRASAEKARNLAVQAIEIFLSKVDVPDNVKAERLERLLTYPKVVEIARVKTCQALAA